MSLTRSARLSHLLESLFDPSALRRFLRSRDVFHHIESELPGPSASGAELADAVVSQLQQHGLLMPLFAALLDERPRRAVDIGRLAGLYGVNTEDTGFLGTPFESIYRNAQTPPLHQVFLNVWFPKFEPRAPRFRVDEPIEMHVDLGPQRHGSRTEPLSDDLRDRLRQLSQVDVWVQCADADVTPCDGTLRLPWPTNVLSFALTPRRAGGLRIVVVLMIHNQPVHRLEREVQVLDQPERGQRWG